MKPMKEPVCLIESDGEGSLHMVPSSLKILQQIEQKVVVVSVVGIFRSGKSYLMNRLARAQTGFPLGSTIQSKTKGIWMWCVPHPKKTDHTLVLLDTEGLADFEKGNTKNDNWIFAMAVLLSSTLVYNSMGVIDNKSMENLQYVTELTKNIRVKSNEDENDDRSYVGFLPSFVWAVRDFALELEIDGRSITEDEYLEHGLKEKQGEKNQQYNEPRACLRKFFLSRHCFVFERPATSKKMKQMEKMTDADLDKDFVEQANKFTEHIYTKSDTKTLSGGIKVTGILLGQLAETYVKAIRSGEVPCLENAVNALAEIENVKAVEQAQVHYVQKMESVRFPTNTLEELFAIHSSSHEEALALFTKRSFKDDNHRYLKELGSVLQGKYSQLCEKNVNESRKACEQIIQRVFKSLEDNVGAGLYSVSGGYKTFCQDREVMTGKYRREDRRGVKAEEVLKTYLDEKAVVGKAILSADNSLTAGQKREEEMKTESEKAKREREAMKTEQLNMEKTLAQQKIDHDSQTNALTIQIAEEKKGRQEEHAQLNLRLDAEKQRADKMEADLDAEKKRNERGVWDCALWAIHPLAGALNELNRASKS